MSVNSLARGALKLAVEHLADNNVKEARRHIRRALAELSKRPQLLPGWVKPGVCIVLDKEPGRVWRVVSVDRGVEWSFRCVDTLRPVHALLTFRERGLRCWSRYSGVSLGSRRPDRVA